MQVARYVYEELGQGHTEKTYQRGMQAVLNHRQIFHTTEAPIPISILGQVIGNGRCDILVGDYALELKANSSPPSRATGQLQKYLTGLNKGSNTNFDGESTPRSYRGVVINFNQKQHQVDFLEVVPVPEKVIGRDFLKILKNAPTRHFADAIRSDTTDEPHVVLDDPPVEQRVRRGAPKHVPKQRSKDVKSFLGLHLKKVSDPDSLVPVSEMKDSYERFLGGAMDMSLPEFQRKLRLELRNTTIASCTHWCRREIAYGSRDAKHPGLILLA